MITLNETCLSVAKLEEELKKRSPDFAYFMVEVYPTIKSKQMDELTLRSATQESVTCLAGAKDPDCMERIIGNGQMVETALKIVFIKWLSEAFEQKRLECEPLDKLMAKTIFNEEWMKTANTLCIETVFFTMCEFAGVSIQMME